MAISFGRFSRRFRTLSAVTLVVALLTVLICLDFPCRAQDLQPRRWGHLPVGANFSGLAFSYTEADITFDPVLLIDDVKLNLSTVPVKYIRSFEFAGKSARIDLQEAYQEAEWNGRVDGVPTRVTRSGWSDMVLRFSVNIFGAPPLRGAEYAAYRAATESETIVGLGLELQLPTGQYFNDKLLNLGTNRVTLRPQLGVVHREGKWSTELTAASWFYTDNNDFFNGNELSQNPIHTLQGFVDYTFKPGLWCGGGIAYGQGGESTINQVFKDDPRDSLVWGLALGVPLSNQVGAQLSYLSQRTLTEVGVDSDSLLASMSIRW